MEEFSYFCSDHNMRQWLNYVFRDKDIPSFEETPEFIESLKKIMNENEAAEKDAKIIIKAEKNLKDFYNEKDKELQVVTDFIQLNSDTCRRVQSLALLAENMKLKEPSLTNFLLAMTEIEDKESMQAEKKLFTSHHMSVFSKKIKHTMKINEKLRRHLKSLTKVVEMQKTQYAEIASRKNYFEKKNTEIKSMIEASREKLKNAGYLEEVKTPSDLDKEKQESLGGAVYAEKTEIRHSVLVEKAQKLKDLEDYRKTLENKLQMYHSLNPNFEDAIKAVQNKENELIQLEKDLQMLLQGFETS